MSKKVEIKPGKKYVLLCSPEDIENLRNELFKDTSIVVAIAVRDGKIIDIETAKTLIDDMVSTAATSDREASDV